MSSIPVANAMENMPACSAPASCDATMERIGSDMPQTVVPIVFHT